MAKKIAVIFGGRTAEHDVSIITAHTPIIRSLQAGGQYEVIPVYITKTGAWYSEPAMNDMAYFADGKAAEKVAKLRQLEFSFDDGFTLIWPGLRAKKQKIDIVFPSMHGTYGEDGSLMGMLRMANVAFVGCDMAASAVAMDKVFTKQVLEANRVPVVPYVWFTRAQWSENTKELTAQINKLAFPVFVKPVHLGSSIAITRAKNADELTNAIEVALHYDDKVLVEESVENLIEVTLPMMGNDTVTFANVERALNKTEFFDFNEKYLSGGKKKNGGQAQGQYSEMPAKIGDALTKRVKELGEQTYLTLGCTGIARVDFLIDSKKNEVYVNEVNTLPGSLYAHNWRTVGVSPLDLVLGLVKLAEERHVVESKIVYTFNSDILQKVDGPKSQS